MDTTVIVTTYNWPQALALVLKGLARQSQLPGEVVVADDGSGAPTRDLLQSVARDFPVPLRHSWQEDAGFRLSRSRNRAIAAARGDYLLIMDGDMVPHRDFVADHARHATPGSVMQGSRVLTTPQLSQRMLADGTIDLGVFTANVGRRRNLLHAPALARLNLARQRRRPPRAIKGCNQGWWRADLLRLNGFDERMQGWGREDEEIAWRAWHAGIDTRHLRFAGLAWHLYHPEKHEQGESVNDPYLRETRETRSVRAEHGLDAHLAEFAAQPLPDLRDA